MKEKKYLFPIVFSTKNLNWYIYDNTTQVVLNIPSKIGVDLKNNLDKIGKKNSDHIRIYEILDNIKKIYKNYDLFNINSNTPSKIEDIIDLKKHTKLNGLKQLTLIVTENCNFRCKYCFYSENYSNTRTFTTKNMEWNVAKEAIDYYFQFNMESVRINPNLLPMVGFYGGEPLLKWELVKKCVEYIKKKYVKYFKKINFLITTNGSLLEEKHINYMIENNFSISISFDGNKVDHNRNRVDINNKGTFDNVIKKIRLVDSLFENSLKEGLIPYTLLVTYDNSSNIDATLEYIESHDFLRKHLARVTKVNSTNTSYYLSQNKKNLSDSQIFNKIKSVCDSNKPSLTSQLLFNSYTNSVKNICAYEQNMLRGSCVPGNQKIAVNCDGKFYICEKIDFQSSIGNTQIGIDWDAQKKIANNFLELVQEKCKDCNRTNLCNLCFAVCANGEDEFKVHNQMCESVKKNAEKMFALYFTVLENEVSLQE